MWTFFRGPLADTVRSSEGSMTSTTSGSATIDGRVTGRFWATIALLSLIWGMPYYLIKVALVELSPACVAWGRITIGALVLLPLAWRRGALRNVTAHWGAVLAFALVEMVGPFMLIATAEMWVSSSLTAILIATSPLMIVLLDPLFGRTERVGARRLSGLVLGFVGVIALVGIEGAESSQGLLGAGFILLASLGYSIGPLIAQHRLKDVDPLGSMGVALAIASVILATPAWLTAPEVRPSPTAWGAVVVLGSLCTATALVLFVTVIVKAGASRASIIAYLAPTIAVLLGVLALDEHFGLWTLAGLILIFGGSWLASGRSPSTASSG
jgi:drug/metabolite transporter (DMT)-like permease